MEITRLVGRKDRAAVVEALAHADPERENQ
jgi:hypothetical protein